MKKFNELTKEQQEEVKRVYLAFKEDEGFSCGKNVCFTIEEFWDNHKEEDFKEMLK